MAVGKNTYQGMAVPLAGESEIVALNPANDVLTITAAPSQAGDLLVLRLSDGTELFSCDKDGNVVTAGTVTADGTLLTGAG